GDQDISEAGQLLADTQGNVVEQPDDIDRHDGDLLLAVSEDNGPRHERIMHFRRLAVLAEAREPDGGLGGVGGDIGFAEADVEQLGANDRSEHGGADDASKEFAHVSPSSNRNRSSRYLPRLALAGLSTQADQPRTHFSPQSAKTLRDSEL